MATNLISVGDHLTLVAAETIVSGQLVVVGKISGVASHDAAIGEDVTLATRGVYSLPKVSAQAWTVGQLVYFDDTANLCTTTAASNVLIGVAVKIAANPTGTGEVRLNGSFA